MDCRPGCGACCIAPSISSAIPGMPGGKPAGVRCVQLDDALRCRIFGHPERPACCGGLQASAEMCGDGRSHALQWLTQLDAATQPAHESPAQPGRSISVCGIPSSMYGAPTTAKPASS